MSPRICERPGHSGGLVFIFLTLENKILELRSRALFTMLIGSCVCFSPNFQYTY